MSSMSMSTAFTASCARVASARTIAFAGNRLCARPVVVRRARGAARMAAEEKKPESDVSNPKRTQMEEEADTPLSVWGVVSFGIIFAIFGIAVAATLARDFFPGGLAPPV